MVRSVPSSSVFSKSFYRLKLCLSYMFERIHQWDHLGLGFLWEDVIQRILK